MVNPLMNQVQKPLVSKKQKISGFDLYLQDVGLERKQSPIGVWRKKGQFIVWLESKLTLGEEPKSDFTWPL
jgi:hypothetical protein